MRRPVWWFGPSGLRNWCKPLKSLLCSSSKPSEVAKAFDSLGFRYPSVADLDAISGGRLDLFLHKCLVSKGIMEIMVDPGEVFRGLPKPWKL
ncbi:hypothetical protein KEJ36_00695 [Candidatus Bathyarchaeota archaeon]|nr:hypothetical protein [Candidatus Bathyarchaeota archaeon]MBS7627342.1 hypothetical protein [Candidatus Bathyarchaeota archaeon]